MAAGLNPADMARVRKRMDAFADEISGKAQADRLRRLARDLQREAVEAVRESPARSGSLADGSMSGWHRGRPVRLATRVTSHLAGDRKTLLVTPDRTAGLWRVLESGRRAQTKGDRIARGVTKKGNVRMRRVKRTMGATEGKGTWSRASEAMVRRSRAELPRHVVSTFRKTFGGS